MKLLLQNAKRISIIVVGIFLLGGCSEEDDNLPKVVAGFTQTISDSGTASFINTSVNAQNYLWDFGDESISTEINPIKTFASGTYAVTLTAINIAGATDIFTDTLTIIIKDKISLPATFDDDNVNYDATAFDGASFEIVNNPDVSGTNNKETKVGAIANSGVAFEGIFFDLGVQLDLATKKTVTMNFWADAPVDVVLKLEKGTANTETTVSHGGTGWETISFDFMSSDKFSKLTIFVDGPGTTAGTFFIDDIEQIATPDLTPPVITLLGNATVTVAVSSIYNDLGATATDNIDGDLTGDIITVGVEDVDTSVEGDYLITYNVSDAAGNAAVEVTRTVTVDADAVLDTEAPVITLSGDNPAAHVQGDSWTEPGYMATDNIDGTITGDVVIGGDVIDASTTPGNYVITYNVTDAAGNAADEVTRDVIVSAAGCAAETTQSLSESDFNLTFQTDPGGSIVDDGVVLTLVDNPNSSNSVNSSCKVGQLARNPAFPFANNNISFDTKFDFNASSGFKMKVYAEGTGYMVTLKLEDKNSAGAIATEVSKTTTVGSNEWEELTFDFPSSESGKYDKIVLFFDLNTSSDGTYFFDDLVLYGSGGGGGSLPPTAAPTPPVRDAADVVSLFSDAYTNITIDTWSAVWDDSSQEDVQVDGNTTKKINFVNFIGVEFINDRINATDFTHFHIDIFTDTETLDKSFNLKLSDWAGGGGENSAIEFSTNNASTPALPNPNPGTWISLDIPFSSWPSAVGGLSRADLAQFIITSNLGEVYVDNIYLYK